MKTYHGSWELKTATWNDDDSSLIELSETTLDHIAELIKEGYTSGDIVEEVEDK